MKEKTRKSKFVICILNFLKKVVDKTITLYYNIEVD